VRQWVRRQDAPPEEPAAFAAFLAVKARRPHRSLERALDWVLWVYRTLWPVLVREREDGEGGRGGRCLERRACGRFSFSLSHVTRLPPSPSLSPSHR